jgi:hypothetical protein
MGLPETCRLSRRIHVQQKIDVALNIATHILGAVIANMAEAHCRKQPREAFGIGPGKFDELKSVQAQYVVMRGQNGLQFIEKSEWLG